LLFFPNGLFSSHLKQFALFHLLLHDIDILLFHIPMLLTYILFKSLVLFLLQFLLSLLFSLELLYILNELLVEDLFTLLFHLFNLILEIYLVVALLNCIRIEQLTI
jgi:hypothetical protein